MNQAVTLLLHRAPGAGFDEPFEMLAACHERMQRMLALLQRLDHHLQQQGADAVAAEAARDVLRYFDIAGPAHHEDEERHILPRLAALGQKALAQHLAADHRAMSEAWADMRPDLAALAERQLAPDRIALALPLWRAFAVLYRAHLAIEETSAFPPVLAEASLPALQAMGAEMAQRRGLPPQPMPPLMPAQGRPGPKAPA